MEIPRYLVVICMLLCVLHCCEARVIGIAMPLAEGRFPRPSYTEYAKMVRWLVHLNSWGSLATLDKDSGRPSGGVVSISDGSWNNSTGRIIMYLTPLDYTAQNVQANPDAALILTESQLLPQGCGNTDPENPTCARVEVVGKVKQVSQEEVDNVKSMMFSRHPEMADWPQGHHFYFSELQPEAFHLLDFFGGVHTVAPHDYFAVNMSPEARTLQ